MKELKAIYQTPDDLHHAWLIEGNIENITPELLTFFEHTVKVPIHGNPDFLHFHSNTFGIDDSRELKFRAAQKAIRERKIFIISFFTMTHEAQNALLKLFEEPVRNTHFFLVTEHGSTLLPTLRSRLEHIKVASKKTEDSLTEQFFKAHKAVRLELLKDVIERKDKQKALDFLSNLESYLYTSGTYKDKKYRMLVSEIGRHKQYLFDRGSSVKMIIEHIALITPN